MGWFNFARSPGFPTQYAEQHISANVDVVIAGLILSLVILAISIFAILPAYNKNKRWALLIRILLGFLIGGILLVANYGDNWENGKVHMSSPYKPSSHEEIEGIITLHVALRGINVTLKGRPIKHEGEGISELSLQKSERIDYNENFNWEWAQGRFGFGYYAGQISKDFRSASERGAPLPILQIAEYFTFDGEGIRFGRYYRLAGWYAHILMWTAFVTWLISNILFSMIVSSAASFLLLTGFLQLSAIGVWTFLRNPIEIQVPFQSANGHGDVILRTYFGSDYYLVLANGVLCSLLGFFIICLDSYIPDKMCTFFGIDPLTIYDELHLSKTDIISQAKESSDGKSDTSTVSHKPFPLDSHHGKKVSFHGSVDEDASADNAESTLVLKRRTNVGSKLFQKSFRIKPKPLPRKPGGYGESLQPDVERALLSRSGNDTSDDEAEINWPPPPRESILKRPPTPPPKR